MEFSTASLLSPDLLDAAACRALWRARFWPDGCLCPSCGITATALQTAGWIDGARIHCHDCGSWYTWRTGTILDGRSIDERTLTIVAALLSFGVPASKIASVVGLSPDSIRRWRQRLQIGQP